MKVAWDCCRIAFHTGITDPDQFWRRKDKGLFRFPPGWELTETDISGARYTVVIFDVDVLPTADDAKIVRRELAKLRNPRKRRLLRRDARVGR